MNDFVKDGPRSASRATWLLKVATSTALVSVMAAGCGDDETGDAGARPEPEETAPPVLTPYDARGPFRVGFRRLAIPAEDRVPELVVKAWYPAAAAAGDPGAMEAIDYDVVLKQPDWRDLSPPVIHGHAARDAAADAAGGPRPLVIFSHGYSLNPEWYAELVEHYASKGFVVLAPEHAEADWLAAAAASFARPRDVTRIIDLAERLVSDGGDLGATIDAGRIAVVGHSYGGYTALAVAGARFDLAPFEERCAALAPEDPKTFFCAPFQGRAAEMATLAGLDAPPDGLWPSLGDPRVDAIVPMAGDAYLFNAAGLASVTIPMMAIGGTMDFGTPWEWGAKLGYDHVSSARKSLVAFEGADHMIPTEPCENMPFSAGLPELHRQAICSDPAWDKAVARKWIRHYSTAFLLEVLMEDAAAKAALGPDAEPVPGIVHTATIP